MHTFHALLAEIDEAVERTSETTARRAELLARARAIGRAIDERVRRLVERRDSNSTGAARYREASGGPARWASGYDGGPAESRSTGRP